MTSADLIFPPLTGVNYPYLSTPSLVAFVKENSAHTVCQTDLNTRYVAHALSSSVIERRLQQAHDLLRCLDKKPDIRWRDAITYARAVRAVERSPYFVDAVENSLRTLRSANLLKYPRQIERADQVIKEALT